MKKIKCCVRYALVASLFVFATACSTTPTGPNAKLSRFKDDSSVSVVLQFYRWDSIYLTRPDTRADGFLPVLNKDQVTREIQHRAMTKEKAVVVFGYTYSLEQIALLSNDWKKIMAAQGFRRVIFLRAGGNGQIDGLPVLEDYAISTSDETPGAKTVVALPAALGADAKNPSVATVR